MKEQGEFFSSISRLQANLSNVRADWNDQTAKTYDQINENIEELTAEIWSCHIEAVECCDMIKANYDEAEFERELNQLASEAYSV